MLSIRASNLAALPKLSIRKGREYQVSRGHPWLFSGAISQAPSKISPGALVDLVDTDGCFIARGYYNPTCDIAVRILSRDKEETVDREFLAKRLAEACALRQAALDWQSTNAFRLVNAEGDFLPGFIVDYYDGICVVQSHTAGADLLMEDFLPALQSVLAPRAVVLRNDAGVRVREGLPLAEPIVVHGTIPDELIVKENGLSFVVDVVGGQKTGFFTDQREKRASLARYCRSLPAIAAVANVFSYTGAFGVYAARADSAVQTFNVDSSGRALAVARRNYELNGIPLEQHEFVEADAFEWLAEQERTGKQFDVVILDPPAFAKGHKEKSRAQKAYVRMDASGINITRSGGLLIVCSCTGAVSLAEFEDCLREAAAARGRAVQILETFRNSLDHPVNVTTPESFYLKVLFCRVL